MNTKKVWIKPQLKAIVLNSARNVGPINGDGGSAKKS
jgi:hypothetical protein